MSVIIRRDKTASGKERSEMQKATANQTQRALRAALFPAALAVALAVVHSAQAQQESEQPAPKTKTERLLKADLDPFAADENGWTHMHWAAAADDGDAINRLVGLGAISDPVALADKSKFSPDGQRRAGPLGLQMADWVNKGQTPLHVAAELNKRIAASVLIAGGANINAKDARGDTPLDSAISGEHVAMQTLLRRHGGSDCNTAIAKAFSRHSAARANNEYAVRCLIENGANVNAKDNLGRTLLHSAAEGNATETAALLLKSGAQVNAKSDNGGTPLHSAAYNNATEAAALLLKNGAQVNAKSDNGGTPLHSAAYNNATEAAALLLKSGAQVNAKNDDGGTPLHSAAYNNATETAALLLKSGAQVNAKDRWNDTPLDDAISKGLTEMQSLLSRHGGEYDARGTPPPTNTITEIALRECGVWKGQLSPSARVDTGGNETAFRLNRVLIGCKELYNNSHLHLAANLNDFNAARWLIANGADVNATGWGGYTPLHLATGVNFIEMATLLLKNGADVNAADGFGNTSLDLATDLHGPEATKSLLRRHGGRCNESC